MRLQAGSFKDKSFPQLDLFGFDAVEKLSQDGIAFFQNFSHEQRTDLTSSGIVKDEILNIFKRRPNEWLEYGDFVEVGIRHDINHMLGHILSSLARNGIVNSKDIYFGSKHPREGNYQGFKTAYLFNLDAVKSEAQSSQTQGT
jgi:hypothetical protein